MDYINTLLSICGGISIIGGAAAIGAAQRYENAKGS